MASRAGGRERREAQTTVGLEVDAWGVPAGVEGITSRSWRALLLLGTTTRARTGRRALDGTASDVIDEGKRM